MTQSYSTESVQARLEALGLPFSDVFARALVALVTSRKISLHSVTQLMPGEQNAEANRQQLRRCLEHENLTPDSWAEVIQPLLPKGKWVLSLDRTECLHIPVKWKRGDTTINLLVLAVVVYGSAVPLLWTVMPSCGASASTQLRESDTTERIELLGRFITLFTRRRLRFLTADREFIGKDWIAWLLSEQLPFRIRIKANTFTHL